MLIVPRCIPRRAGEDHPDVQGRLGSTRLVMALQPPSSKSGTLQSDVDIPGKQDWCYGPPLPKRSDDDDDDDDVWSLLCVFIDICRCLLLLIGFNNMEMKREADSNDISAECSYDDKPSVGMFPISE